MILLRTRRRETEKEENIWSADKKMGEEKLRIFLERENIRSAEDKKNGEGNGRN